MPRATGDIRAERDLVVLRSAAAARLQGAGTGTAAGLRLWAKRNSLGVREPVVHEAQAELPLEPVVGAWRSPAD